MRVVQDGWETLSSTLSPPRTLGGKTTLLGPGHEERQGLGGGHESGLSPPGLDGSIQP